MIFLICVLFSSWPEAGLFVTFVASSDLGSTAKTAAMMTAAAAIDAIATAFCPDT
jgi:hypothetical protein